jgi:hypothetical protein
MDRTNNFDFLNQLDLDADVVRRLSQHLMRTVTGDETVIIAPIAEHISPVKILEMWDKVFTKNRSKMSNDLLDLEEQNRSKFGPRSIAIPWEERRSGVEKYFDDKYKPVREVDQNLLVGRGLAPRHRPLSIESARKLLKNNTNSGLPYFTRKSNVKDSVASDLRNLLIRNDPCIMFTRTQEDRKTRPVWGYPIADSLQEMRFYRPLFDYQSKLIWRSALRGPDEVDRHLVNLVLSARDTKDKLVSIDFSAYDTTVKTQLQDASFRYIKSLFQTHFHLELDEVAKRFNSIGLITPDGVVTGAHGVPSGSTFTNEVDSLAQYLIAKTLNIPDENIDIQGDDGAYLYSDPDELKDRFRDYGLNVNDEKSYVSSTSLIYLQNLYDYEHIKDGINGGIYPCYRALNRIIYPERFNDFSVDGIIGSDYFSIRSIAILENCKHHPLFPDLVGLIYNLDKYNLKFTDSGLSKYIERINRSKGSVGIIQNQYGDNLKGLKAFKTLQVLNELNP